MEMKILFTQTCLEFNLFEPSVAFYIKTSHSICSAYQMTGFYKKCSTGLIFQNEKQINLSNQLKPI